jgi:D-2-hydroxyacid dehydrogenase (NADP+)
MRVAPPPMPPAVHVGPDAEPAIARAVEAAGARLAPFEDADAVVWLGHDPDALPPLPERVRWVQLPSAGVEKWLERVGREEGGVTFTSAGGAYALPVAEHALALLLAGVRGLVTDARARSWVDRSGPTLEGATVAIVGAGGIGRALISLLAPLEVEVLAVTRRGHPVDGAARTLPADRVGEVWGAADHVVIAAPATGATRHLVGAPELEAMRDEAWLVNVARGSLIDTDALVRALADEQIGGAALDVTDPEPLPDGHPLWEEPRALISPHAANPPAAQWRHLSRHVEENVRRFAAGDQLLAPIDPSAGY